MHNTCPLCRFEVSNKQFENKNGINQNNSNISLNNTVFEDVE